jgi:predicted alpha/beta superfamily hydrolase
MRSIFIALFVCISIICFAQYPEVTIPGSEVRKITSNIVQGQEYDLQILLPAGYEKSTKSYPTVYVMDSQWDFPLMKSLYGNQFYDGFIPEAIIVGITWGGKRPNPDSLRVRDYTPTNDGRAKQGGGADKFLDFIKSEVFPFMSKNYRVNDDRSLVGCSLGGLFTIYAMLTHTEMFRGYAAASPAVGWDREVLYKFETAFAEKKLHTPVRLFMTVGDVERGRPTFEKMADHFKSRNYSHAKIVAKVLDNTGHTGTKAPTYGPGMQFIFERNNLTLPADKLAKIVGNYQLANGNKIEIKVEGSELYWYFSPQNKVRLYVNSDTHLYGNHETFNLIAKESNGVIEGFEWGRYGGSQFIKKI